MSFRPAFPHTLLREIASATSHLLNWIISFFLHVLFAVEPAHNHVPQRQFNLADFDVDYTTGFLPARPPISRLSAEFELWEQALDKANCQNSVLSLGEDYSPEALAKRDSSAQWRAHFQSAPVLPTSSLHNDVELLRRAHHVLAFLVHFYVHSTPPTPTQAVHIPASLAVPLVTVSRVLGIAPILTFADTVLWNYALIDPTQPLSPTNMRFQTLFTGTQDETSFYLCCAQIELRGVPALRAISNYENLASIGDNDSLAKVACVLEDVAAVINDLTSTLQSVRCTCEPSVFYHAIRPWFRGSDASGPESPNWVFEGVEDSDRLDLSGPSAGQSSLMHSLDVFLDVDHSLEKPRLPAPSEQNQRADHKFMKRMQRYMPSIHQNFLQFLSATPRCVRNVARCHPSLIDPYNACVTALKQFRDAHLRVACLYVVSMSRAAPKPGCPVGAMMLKMQAEGALTCPVTGESLKRQPVRGTGGNELSLLLKACRDATTRTLLDR
ncbi:hypothetical protein BOTBODRAFT_178074 [Botryobasidium botryosum FD-172 SS1]|uniref:Indoleamine 2,3-dioxygenase n=1 Tax=Botryobasidium botryosum (strain FD-172 SS1) TaxID=930990 RepID=A0A067MG94_BOTB1|nr:hypothetical protein BOTBODRAFT_178074 [Botryobasidium botryosum FD-172 SS1]